MGKKETFRSHRLLRSTGIIVEKRYDHVHLKHCRLRNFITVTKSQASWIAFMFMEPAIVLQARGTQKKLNLEKVLVVYDVRSLIPVMLQPTGCCFMATKSKILH